MITTFPQPDLSDIRVRDGFGMTMGKLPAYEKSFCQRGRPSRRQVNTVRCADC